jgi:hypothetical protein
MSTTVQTQVRELRGYSLRIRLTIRLSGQRPVTAPVAERSRTHTRHRPVPVGPEASGQGRAGAVLTWSPHETVAVATVLPAQRPCAARWLAPEPGHIGYRPGASGRSVGLLGPPGGASGLVTARQPICIRSAEWAGGRRSYSPGRTNSAGISHPHNDSAMSSVQGPDAGTKHGSVGRIEGG